MDDSRATNVAGIWAIGDVTQYGGFTHTARHMGYVAARNATRARRLTQPTHIDTRVVPRVTYTDPRGRIHRDHRSPSRRGSVDESPTSRWTESTGPSPPVKPKAS